MIPIIVLNLERTPQRKEIMETQFKKIGISNYFFFPAFDGRHISNLTFNINIGMGYGSGRFFQKGELGIIITHLAAIKMAQVLNYEEVIILEDDVALCHDWFERLKILQERLPQDWEYVYLSGHSDYVRFQNYSNPTLIKSPKMIGAFSYIIKNTAYSKVSKFCSSFMTTFDDLIMHMIDQGKLNSYTYFPFMTFHNAEESTVWNKVEHATSQHMHSSYKFFKDRL